MADPGWSVGGVADYDGDGRLDLYVANYLDVGPGNLPAESERCRYRGVPCACGPIGLRGAADTLYRQGADGTFVEVTAEAGILDRRYFGLGAVWGMSTTTGTSTST